MNLTSFNFLGPIHPPFGSTYEMYICIMLQQCKTYILGIFWQGVNWVFGGFFFTQVAEFKNKTKLQSLPDKKENFINKVLVEDWQK